MKTNLTVLSALPYKGASAAIREALLQIASSDRIVLKDTDDFYNLKTIIRETDPALVVTSPILVSDPLLPLFKEEIQMQGIKYVACCITTPETEYLKNYDAKFTLSESAGDIARTIEELLAGNDGEDEAEETLTAREKEVIIYVVKGLTNKEIAAQLFISTHTVITHRKNIARKLDIHSPAGLTVYAIMNKLVDLEDIGV